MNNKAFYISQVSDLLEEAIDDDELIEDIINTLDGFGYFTAPASTHYHGSFKGGLVEHSLNVTKHLMSLTYDRRLKWQLDRSPVIIGLFHDLCKCDAYVFVKNDLGIESCIEWNKNQVLEGHGEKSVMIASHLMQLTMEEIMCIRYHMGAYLTLEEQKDLQKNWKLLNKAIEKYPNILYTHLADMLATYVDEKG